MRLVSCAAAGLVGLALLATSPVPVVAAPGPAGDCRVAAGGAETGGRPWAQTRLGFQRAWSITEGAGVLIAVVDTGVDVHQPQMAAISYRPGINVLSGFPPRDVTDCVGHGTSVTGIIAAPKVTGVQFVGVAPQATVLPIKQTNTPNDGTGTAAGLAAGIDAAVQARAQVVNVSVTVTQPTPVLRAAVARAAQADVVIVAAAGNDGAGNNFKAYPAAYSTEFDNVLAVSATDQNDAVGSFSESGNYVSVAAPGVNVETPTPYSGYTFTSSGTSFAAPFVTGTVALVRSAFPALTAAQVCARIEATADPPPATVPDPKYGYGIVDPYLAVTTVRSEVAAVPARPQSPLPAPVTAPPTDDSLQHLALGLGLGLMGLAAVTAAGIAATRRALAARAGR